MELKLVNTNRTMLSDLDLVGTIQDHDDVPEETDSESNDEDVSLETSVPDSQLY